VTSLQAEDFEELKRAAMEEYGQSQHTFKYPLAGEGGEKVSGLSAARLAMLRHA